MNYFNTFRTENALWTFATARFVVEFHAEPEECAPSDSFEDQDNIDFASEGGAHWFGAVVLVRDVMSGYVIGTDLLGCCSYNSYAEFYKARDGYFIDMVREAISDARKFIKRFADLKTA